SSPWRKLRHRTGLRRAMQIVIGATPTESAPLFCFPAAVHFLSEKIIDHPRRTQSPPATFVNDHGRNSALADSGNAGTPAHGSDAEAAADYSGRPVTRSASPRDAASAGVQPRPEKNWL